MVQKNKIIIFGLGEILQKNILQIKLEDVINFVDNNKKQQGGFLYGRKILAPEELINVNFDYIVIFSSKYFQEIYDQLYYDLGIPIEKIIAWGFFLEFSKINRETIKNYLMINKTISIIKELKCFSILDIDYSIGKHYFFCKEHKNLFGKNNVNIDTIMPCDFKYFPIHSNIYAKVYSQYSIIEKRYDAVFFSNYKKYSGIDDCIKYAFKQQISAKYYILYLPYPYGEGNYNDFKLDVSRWGCVKKFAFSHGYIVVIEAKTESIKIDLKIYVVTHKHFLPPKDKLRLPIQAGHNGNDLGYIKDSLGDNISELNPYINECTALYWLWKNATCKYIGLEHYRRYFLNNEIKSRGNLLTKEHISALLADYDIILVDAMSFYPITVAESVMIDTDKTIYEKAYKVIRKLIFERHPDYLEAFDYVMAGYVFFKCNMFITSKRIMDKYCEWLFSFIIDAAKTVDVKDQSVHNQRIVGFLAERLLTVWLMKQDFHIKEMPILELK